MFRGLLKIGVFHFLILLLHASPADAEKFHFKEYPVDQSVFVGSNLTLRCSIMRYHGGSNPFHIQWRTNKGIILNQRNEIPGYSGRYSYSTNNPEELHLNIRNVSKEDEGQFQCQVLKLDKSFRVNAFVKVLGPSPSNVHLQRYQSGRIVDSAYSSNVPSSNSKIVKKAPCNSSSLQVTLFGSLALLLMLFIFFLAVMLRLNPSKKASQSRSSYVKSDENYAIELPTDRHHLQNYSNIPCFN
uniref:Ig-like domain-containing protein n=1 Tax=Globodera rostochiensis TaxID=31243 RepID=A0A914HE49_GLORO